ncbi:MAG TPA: polysaccharide ABC transporter ATP-binding protein [Pyrinomonadaceae bacterium]|nr:polysaccharide ABC transporter ATP-binding protein [Pyrinomonadaceae bacterium]
MKPIIRVENVSKRYRIGELDAGYATLREMVASAFLAPLRNLRRGRGWKGESVWALRDIDFEVAPGETLGLVGRNGAGKSTLLKILSRITVPTTGRTEVYGRIGSLLEVGTGFHPDLTGRENIFLNGAVLGLRRAEIASRFDQIVAFSELEKFIDTPVKFYSSGMYLRLAFSVAAHLDSEVLFMDEVLAVGDVTFQQKCLDKMHEIRNQGRTIIFVSHSMTALTRLCRRCIWIEQGRIVQDGESHRVVNEYLGASWRVTAERAWADGEDAPGGDTARLVRVRVRDTEGATAGSTDIRRAVGVELTYDVLRAGAVLTPKIELSNEEGELIFTAHDLGERWRYREREPGRYVSTVWIPGNFLSEGHMVVSASVVSHTPATQLHARAPNAVGFQVIDNQHKDSARGDYVGPVPGFVRPLLDWETEFQGARAAPRVADPLELTSTQ